MTSSIIEIAPVDLTPEAFRPYGKVVRRPETDPRLAIGDVQSPDVPFEAGSPVRLRESAFA